MAKKSLRKKVKKPRKTRKVRGGNGSCEEYGIWRCGKCSGCTFKEEDGFCSECGYTDHSY